MHIFALVLTGLTAFGWLTPGGSYADKDEEDRQERLSYLAAKTERSEEDRQECLSY